MQVAFFHRGWRRDKKRKWCIDVEKKKELAGKSESEILIGLRSCIVAQALTSIFTCTPGFQPPNRIELPFLTIAMGTGVVVVCAVCVRDYLRVHPSAPRQLPIESY